MMQPILITATILIVWLLCAGFIMAGLWAAKTSDDWRVRYAFSEVSKTQKILLVVFAPLVVAGSIIKALVLNWHLTLAAVCILYVLKGIL